MSAFQYFSFFPLILLPLAWLWFTLINHLRVEWSVNPQYAYGWAVPFLCLYLLWGKAEMLKAEMLKAEGGGGKAPILKAEMLKAEMLKAGGGGGKAPTLKAEMLKAEMRKAESTAERVESRKQKAEIGGGKAEMLKSEDPDQSQDTGYFSFPAFQLFSFFLLSFLYLPTRLIQEANPEWRLVSWALALEVIGLTLLLLKAAEDGRRKTDPGSRITHHASRFTFPILFFLVAVPWPTLIEGPIVQGLMRANIGATIELLGALGIPAIPHGNVIEIATGVVGIDDACSGIRSFQATLMLSLFFGELYALRAGRRVICVFAGFALAFLFNVGRTLLLTWVASAKGVGAVASWHDPAGVTILVGCFGSLWVIARLLRKAETLKAEMLKSAGQSGGGKAETLKAEMLKSESRAGNAQSRTGNAETLKAEMLKSKGQSGGEKAEMLKTEMLKSERGGGNAQSRTGNAEKLQSLEQEAELSGPASFSVSEFQRFSVCSPSRFSVSAFQRFSIYLTAWLIVVEGGTELWYRLHEWHVPRTTAWHIEYPRDNPTFRDVPFSEKTKQFLRFDEGHNGAWQEGSGQKWQAIFFRWNPGRIAVHLAKSHTPEVCLTAAGRELVSQSGLRAVPVQGLRLPFRSYVVKDETGPLHVFYCLWEDRANAQSFRTTRMGYANRLAPVLAGRRNSGQRSLEVAIWGIPDQDEADAALARGLEKLIKIEETTDPSKR